MRWWASIQHHGGVRALPLDDLNRLTDRLEIQDRRASGNKYDIGQRDGSCSILTAMRRRIEQNKIPALCLQFIQLRCQVIRCTAFDPGPFDLPPSSPGTRTALRIDIQDHGITTQFVGQHRKMKAKSRLARSTFLRKQTDRPHGHFSLIRWQAFGKGTK